MNLPLRAVWSVVLTVDPTEARRARTGVAVHAVCAVGPVLAGVAGTLVHIFLAFGALEACQAVAGEAVDAVRTGAPVVAGICGGREGDWHHIRSTRRREEGLWGALPRSAVISLSMPSSITPPTNPPESEPHTSGSLLLACLEFAF